jgi:ABC-type hemin transport system substrate-binding protein
MKRTGGVTMEAMATVTPDVLVMVDTVTVATAAAIEAAVAVTDGADVRYAKKHGPELPRLPVIHC